MSDSQGENKGEITEAKYKDGPCPDRGCTDILCCLIFVIFCTGLLIIAGFSLKKGDPRTLATPYDPDHRGCGVDSGVEDYPFIYFTSPDPDFLWRTVCLKECPKKGDKVLKCAVNKYVKDCDGIQYPIIKLSDSKSNETKKTDKVDKVEEKDKPEADKVEKKDKPEVDKVEKKDKPETDKVEKKDKPEADKVEKKDKPTKSTRMLDNKSMYKKIKPAHKFGIIDFKERTYIYDSKPLFGRICIPKLDSLMDNVKGSVNIGEAQNALGDMKKTWPISVASFFIAFIISFVFLLMIRYCGGCIIWTLIISINICLIISAAFFLYGGFAGKKSDETEDQKSNQTQQKTLGIILGAAALLIFILTICMCSRIKIAIAVLESATLFIKDNVTSLFLPIFTLLLVLVYLICWITISLYLYSIGEKVDKDKSLPFATMKHEKNVIYIGYYQFFGLFWVLAFILASSDFVLASATSIWYFQSGSEQEQYNPMRTSYYRLFRYHLGTVAFGSFILAVVWTIQVLFEYAASQAKKYAGENAFVKFLIKCIRCCLACFERFIQFLNKNAYTITAMKGKNFCSAAKDAFFLIIRNVLRFSAVAGIGSFIIFLGRVFVCLVTALIGYLIITKVPRFADGINSPVYPTVLFGLIGFIIGSLFMSVYGSVADAVLLVFCMDEEIQKTHFNEEAVHCPGPLKDFMDVHAK